MPVLDNIEDDEEYEAASDGLTSGWTNWNMMNWFRPKTKIKDYKQVKALRGFGLLFYSSSSRKGSRNSEGSMAFPYLSLI